MIRYSCSFMDAGTRTAGRELVEEAVTEFPEFTWASTHKEAVERVVDSVEELDRAEVYARTENGTLVGILVVTDDEDDQVGPVMGVQWHFVSADYRNGPVGARLLKGAIKAAKLARYNVLAYTHRLGEGRYEINYRRLS